MIPRKMMLAAAAAMLVLTSFGAANEASARNYGGNHAFCQWYKQKAMNTGDEYWWARWRRCMSGWYWD
jgi:hypothetical protein